MRREFYDLKLTISHLVVNGCSYTYGHGIDNPTKDGWPALVAKELGVPLINLAFPGQGNQAIFRKTMNYFLHDLGNDNNPFYIHAYTQSARRELYHATDKWGGPLQIYRLIDGSDNTGSSLMKEALLQTDDYGYCLFELEKFQQWVAINSLLDAHNVNHFHTNYMPQTDGNTIEWFNTNYFHIKANIESHLGKLKNFNEVTKHLPKTPCQHETEKGHRCVADYIMSQIHKRYTEIEVVKQKHSTLNDIYVKSFHSLEQLKDPDTNPYKLDWEFGGNIYWLEEVGYDWRNCKYDVAGRPKI